MNPVVMWVSLHHRLFGSYSNGSEELRRLAAARPVETVPRRHAGHCWFPDFRWSGPQFRLDRWGPTGWMLGTTRVTLTRFWVSHWFDQCDSKRFDRPSKRRPAADHVEHSELRGTSKRASR